MVDVGLIDKERSAQNDLIPMHLQVAESTRGDGIGALRDLVLRTEPARVNGQVSKISCVPQNDSLHDPTVYIGLADVREREPNHIDVLPSGLLHRLRRPWNSGRGDVHDQLDLRIDLEDRLRLSEGFVAVVVAWLDGGQN